jgi:hypothetical protein
LPTGSQILSSCTSPVLSLKFGWRNTGINAVRRPRFICTSIVTSLMFGPTLLPK